MGLGLGWMDLRVGGGIEHLTVLITVVTIIVILIMIIIVIMIGIIMTMTTLMRIIAMKVDFLEVAKLGNDDEDHQ